MVDIDIGFEFETITNNQKNKNETDGYIRSFRLVCVSPKTTGGDREYREEGKSAFERYVQYDILKVLSF